MRIVVKLGTSTLTDGTSRLSRARLVDLARQMSELIQMGHELVLVTSGAIAVGREILDDPHLPKSIPAKQMLSAVGQPRLMQVWGGLFDIYGEKTAQVLLTRSDLSSRPRYLNARNALHALIRQGVIPVVNENDTVATEEIRVGDNDNLSALVSNLVDADYLFLLTDQEGLFTQDPRMDPEAELIRVVAEPEIPARLWQAAGGGGRLGVGGMQTKLQAADLARRSGTTVVIARGSLPNVLLRILAGEPLGTRFNPVSSALESRKRYILSGGESGCLIVDRGAAAALKSGGSLLPAGLNSVKGQFERGKTVRVEDLDGNSVARGLVNYDGDECRRLAGCQSVEIEQVLGYYFGDELIHRNNLVLT
jgi:glutamate 5-kinase